MPDCDAKVPIGNWRMNPETRRCVLKDAVHVANCTAKNKDHASVFGKIRCYAKCDPYMNKLRKRTTKRCVKSAVTPETANDIINDHQWVHYSSSLIALQEMVAMSVYKKDEVFVALAISAERHTDRVRILQLLKTYRYVVGVTVIHDPNLRELTPYAKAGRYIQLDEDFKAIFRNGARSKSLLLREIEKYDVPVTVCLDYQFLQRGYYGLRYGTNWLDNQLKGQRKGIGKARQLLEAGASAVYLPNDKSPTHERSSKAKAPDLSELEQMEEENSDDDLTLQYVRTSPLFRSDVKLGAVVAHDGMVRDPEDQRRRFLNEDRPFLKITLQHGKSD